MAIKKKNQKEASYEYVQNQYFFNSPRPGSSRNMQDIVTCFSPLSLHFKKIYTSASSVPKPILCYVLPVYQCIHS